MQDRYVGDIGDYLKLAILRDLKPGRRLGVAWWLFPNEDHNKDGRHIAYLAQADKWRRFDPALFDGLKRIVASNDRRVAALQDADLLAGAVYADDPIPMASTPTLRGILRAEWFSRTRAVLRDCNLLFLDPDNGLETKGFKIGAPKAGKSVGLAELVALQAPGRALVVYHHQTRMAGGHHNELKYWGERLVSLGFATVDALRARPYSARAFFLLNATDELRERAAALAEQWGKDVFTWHPRLGA
jgi:hypothetical protein